MPTPSDAPSGASARRDWLAVLCRTPRVRLLQVLDRGRLPDLPLFERLRGPETGLTLVRGRVGGSGDAFNLGEATVTRATVRVADPVSGKTVMGVAYQLGRDRVRAELAAWADALLQLPAWHELVMTELVRPVRDELAAAWQAESERAARSRVEFFTMVRGEA